MKSLLSVTESNLPFFTKYNNGSGKVEGLLTLPDIFKIMPEKRTRGLYTDQIKEKKKGKINKEQSYLG